MHISGDSTPKEVAKPMVDSQTEDYRLAIQQKKDLEKELQNLRHQKNSRASGSNVEAKIKTKQDEIRMLDKRICMLKVLVNPKNLPELAVSLVFIWVWSWVRTLYQ